MKILLTGITGQVGCELLRALTGKWEIISPTRAEMDLADPLQVRDFIRRVKPDLIINPAAYTAVDKAEREADLALAINAHAPEVMANEARSLGAGIIHYSTDYVFDGTKATPYIESDATNPCNVYGATKRAGEQAIEASGAQYLILRTSWVYGLRGHNFLRTMLNLAEKHDELRIVADQFGAPTWSRTIAETTLKILPSFIESREQAVREIYHLTAQGDTTWHGFADAIFENANLEKKPFLSPITSSEYPTPARRPKNSRMSSDKLIEKFGPLPHWKDALLQCLTERSS
jgi:dTDP-4-dehydrorhamnose reductase